MRGAKIFFFLCFFSCGAEMGLDRESLLLLWASNIVGSIFNWLGLVVCMLACHFCLLYISHLSISYYIWRWVKDQSYLARSVALCSMVHICDGQPSTWTNCQNFFFLAKLLNWLRQSPEAAAGEVLDIFGAMNLCFSSICKSWPFNYVFCDDQLVILESHNYGNKQINNGTSWSYWLRGTSIHAGVARMCYCKTLALSTDCRIYYENYD